MGLLITSSSYSSSERTLRRHNECEVFRQTYFNFKLFIIREVTVDVITVKQITNEGYELRNKL